MVSGKLVDSKICGESGLSRAWVEMFCNMPGETGLSEDVSKLKEYRTKFIFAMNKVGFCYSLHFVLRLTTIKCLHLP